MAGAKTVGSVQLSTKERCVAAAGAALVAAVVVNPLDVVKVSVWVRHMSMQLDGPYCLQASVVPLELARVRIRDWPFVFLPLAELLVCIADKDASTCTPKWSST